MRIIANGWFLDCLTTGSGQYLSALIDAMARMATEHHLTLVGWSGDSTRRQPNEPRSSELHFELVHVATPFDRLNRNLAKLWFEQVSFPRACKVLRADLALVPYWGSPWWRPCPIVVTIHDLIPLLLPAYRGGRMQRAYTCLVSLTSRRAAMVLTDSEASRRDIVEHLGVHPHNVRAVHLAADARFGPVSDPTELARVRQRYRLPDGPFFLYLGGFDVRKNLVRVIDAFARVSEVDASGAASVRLVIAGKLPDQDSLFTPDPREAVRQMGLEDVVLFPGWVDESDKPALYSLALATLFVSEYEGFGLPVLEAQACGCPVVTSGVPEKRGTASSVKSAQNAPGTGGRTRTRGASTNE